MKYKIKDLQCEDRFFGGDNRNDLGGHNGIIFNSLKEICEQLISYHEADFNMELEKKLLKENKINKCLNELSFFEWEVIKI